VLYVARLVLVDLPVHLVHVVSLLWEVQAVVVEAPVWVRRGLVQ
jgi:hypothetical protein